MPLAPFSFPRSSTSLVALFSARLKRKAFPRKSERRKNIDIPDLLLFAFRKRKAVPLVISQRCF